MSYRCLICNKVSESPKKLEIHLQIEHKWGVKRESEVLDKSHDFDIV
jgi:hypothetical protein